jgi:hypothetical protein
MNLPTSQEIVMEISERIREHAKLLKILQADGKAKSAKAFDLLASLSALKDVLEWIDDVTEIQSQDVREIRQ